MFDLYWKIFAPNKFGFIFAYGPTNNKYLYSLRNTYSGIYYW